MVEARQKLESQQQENESVQKEFNSLDDESNIYKLVGPVLLKQDKQEALMAVNGRLEFIEKEMYGLRNQFRRLIVLEKADILGYSKRIEKEIEANQDKSDKKRAEVRES